ncbi:hypothetical protein M404DRAFT_35058 [Pisolithus tinctorius Marx 270]|uniref:Uncharacterized protein n=1 Tax=Pisolithus tinctorius Marx 270 TaxID=870435 RepID=A0A0C3IBJ9_PISTI|nr:hypothetical protein M404DRAFT_35058 [Pisolithus tinctorius Marx 270]
MMGPKRDASQNKDVSPPKRMRTAATSLATLASMSNEPAVPQTESPTTVSTTTSIASHPVPGEPPSSEEPDPTSMPSTGTLPSTSTSITTDGPMSHQSAASQSQDTAAPSQDLSSDNALHASTTITGTIVALGPAPEPCHFDHDRVSTCPEPLLNRIKILSTYCNSDANTFGLRCILPTATWGMTDPYEDHSKVLCNPSTNEPINIWLLGHITSTWFMKNSAPDSQCSITILSLSSKLGQYANRLLSEFSSPKLRSFSPI